MTVRTRLIDLVVNTAVYIDPAPSIAMMVLLSRSIPVALKVIPLII